MKTKLLLIIWVLLLIAIQVQAHNAKAVFKSENGNPMIVYLNGERVNAKPMRTVVTDRVFAGKHHVTIKVLGKHNVKMIHQPIQLRRNHRTRFLIQNMGRRSWPNLMKVHEEPMFERPYNPHVYDRNDNIRNGRFHGKNFNRHQRFESNLLNMRNFMVGMDYQRFDFERVEYAKHHLAQTQLFAQDLAKILNTMSFDYNRLEVATFAYGNVIDKENIYVVFDEFAFSSTKRNFEKFMREHRNY